MATGIYGTFKLADVDPKDIDIFYIFNADFGDSNIVVKNLTAADVFQKIKNPNTNYYLDGQYNLKLPSSIFNAKGIYNIYIQPKQVALNILDCGVLSPNDDIRGVVLDSANFPQSLSSNTQNNGLSGYRIEYIDDISGEKIYGLFRIVTSNFRVEPVSDTITPTNQKLIKYKINENSSLVFLTVTPSSAPRNLPNAAPFIGLPNQKILLTATSFNPVHLEIELTENNIDTLAIGVFGNQSKSVKDGIRTFYDSENNIYKQFDEYIIKDTISDDSLFDIKKERINIDFTKTFENVSQ